MKYTVPSTKVQTPWQIRWTKSLPSWNTQPNHSKYAVSDSERNLETPEYGSKITGDCPATQKSLSLPISGILEHTALFKSRMIVPRWV